MALDAGSRLGPYEVVAPIGAGGMGEVYRARDTKLERDVAIKVLPDELAADEERVARFEREAKVLASLNHPNIASIHGFEESDGVKAIVLELVEGPTLAERIELGPIPVKETIAIAKQIAEALEAGHEAGVIHRDLKPANIKIKEDGTVKVLDYGLAKALEDDTPSGSASELSQSPTLTRHGTQVGVILGTAAYMSPEQARGNRVDKRSDVWAFGAVLYEMLTGKRAFAGADVSDTLAAVLRAEPRWEALPRGTPFRVGDLLSRCLTKDPGDRVHDIADARIELARVFSEPRESSPSEDGRVGRLVLRFKTIAFASLALALVSTGFAVWSLTRVVEPGSRPITRTILRLGAPLYMERSSAVAISPNGEYVAYIAGREESHQIYLRKLEQLEAVPIDGTERAENLFFSYDSQWIGFVVDRKLTKVSVSGGPPLTISDTDVFPPGVGWSPQGVVFPMNYGTALFHVPADGGTPTPLTELDGSRNEKSHRYPEVLPGGQDGALHRVQERYRILG